MKRYLAAAAIPLALLAFSSCGSGPGPSGISSEARQEAEKYWDSALTKCGDSYYGVRVDETLPEGAIYQFKEPQITLREEKVSDADRLNGLEYSAVTGVTYKAYRENFRGQWGPWRGPDMIGGVNAFLLEQVRKLKGRWVVGFDPEHPPRHWRKIDCSQIPR